MEKKCDADRYDILRRANQHCNIESTFNRFEKEAWLLTKTIKSHVENTIDIEHRIHSIRHDNTGSADKEVDKDLNVKYSKRSYLASQYISCPKCQQRILLVSQHDHDLVCGLEDINPISNERDEITLKPLPPRNMSLLDVSFDSISIGWDPPIFDGGEQINDYELKYTSGESCLNIVPCSRWCLKTPLPRNMFKLEGLKASKTYSNIQVRCKNLIGWSDYSEPIKSIKTKEPINPLSPQRLVVETVTSNSISLSWNPPFHCGGGNLKCYELCYTQMIPCDIQRSGQAKKKTRPVQKTERLPCNKVSTILKELQENSIVKDILLRALNDFDKSSKPARLGVIHTCKSSRINRLKLEIERVQASNQVVMDTDVISDGVMQRKTRIAYLNELKCELSLLLKDTEIVEEVQKEDDSIQGYPTNANKETKENEERTENEEKRQIIMNDRESQFLFRQEILNLQIQQYREKCSGNVQRKYFLISQMRSVQPRIHSLESELERLSSSTLSHIASPVLHGDSDQKFERSQLINSLEHELTKSYNCISSWKSEIISSDRESKEFQSLILIKEERLDERKSALMRFKQEREEKLNRHQQKEWTSIAGILRTYLLGWSLYSRRIGSAIVKLKNFEEKHIVTKVFLHWKESQFFRSQTHGIDTQKKNRQFSSAGEAKLFDAENARRENYESIGALIKSVTDNSMIDSLERLDAGTFTPQNQFVGHTKIMLMKGYIHANSNNFEEALQCFRAAIGSFEKQNHSKLSSNSYSQLHSYLEGLITQMLMKLGLWNKAIFHLEDLLFQAKSDNSTINIFSTNVLLGECYSEVGDLSLAKTYFVAAFANKEMKSKKLELRAHHGLQMCYMQLGDKDRSIESKKKCHHLKADINDEITLALGKAKVMEDKLIGVNAKVGIVTQLQRATSKYMFTKRTIETMKKELKQNKKELGIIKEEAKTVQISLYRIREELYKTEQSGEEKVTSSLVHENSQVIEVGELTTMLKNSEQEKVSRFLEYQKRVKDLELEIKNKHDDLSILKSDLELEQCGLMQRILRSRQIRCMCFNSAYTRGNDIMGFNKEMRHLIALSIESDIYVHDLKSGELVEVFNDHLNHNQREKPDAAKSSVTALSFYKSKVFAGSVDKAIRCWDIRTRNVAYTIWGHQSAVTCIQAVDQFLLSGSADTNVILWNSDTGEKLQILQGHTRGILSLYFSQDICLTGDADGEIFVWNLSSFKYHSRLILNPRHKITVVKGGKLEIVCGNETGTISVWWIQSEELLGECKAHNGPVTDVAFDSTKLVSCGMDESIKVIDLMMLQVIQTIRCHGSQLLSIVFDERNLLTMSKDGNIRQWLWGDGNRESHDNIHVFASGENLQEICNKYEVKMSALIKWNSNINLKKMLPGMAIVVGQGHLDKGSKRIKGNASKSSLMDGSRAFSTSRNEVENHDLFPINENIHDEASSLVSRLGKSLDLKMQT